MAREITDDEIEARLDERPDLLTRLDEGDTAALGELIEHATDSKVASTKVTRLRTARPAAAAGG